MAIKTRCCAQNETVTKPARQLKLPPRLQTIAGNIEKNAAVADVGTDHGLLPAYLAQNNLARYIIASDKSEGSLKAALRTAAKYNVGDKIKFIAADGLQGVDISAVDTIVAAGMGGETIIKILEDAPQVKSPGIKLILQPQTKIDKLCHWLRENGYAVRDAIFTRENRRVYTIILAAARLS